MIQILHESLAGSLREIHTRRIQDIQHLQVLKLREEWIRRCRITVFPRTA